jgi:hypothetical protein
MPWLVGVVADAFSLRWGLAIAAFTPLLMWVLSVSSFPVCPHAWFRRLPCVCFMKNRTEPAAQPTIELHECAAEDDSRPMFVPRLVLSFCPFTFCRRLVEQERDST